jgi:hypothetical protein
MHGIWRVSRLAIPPQRKPKRYQMYVFWISLNNHAVRQNKIGRHCDDIPTPSVLCWSESFSKLRIARLNTTLNSTRAPSG